MKQKVSTKQNIIYFILSIIIILVIYVSYQCFMLLKRPSASMIVKNGSLTNYDEVTVYVIRDEEIIDTSEYEGNRQNIIQDANRVANNSAIASYVLDVEPELIEKLKSVDMEIQNLMSTQKNIYSADVKNIENEIQKIIYGKLQRNNNMYDLLVMKKNITKNLEKKAKIVGELSPTGSKINTLIDKRIEYEKELNNSKKTLKSEKAGLISYRIDGYENVLTPDSFSEITIKDLEKIKIATNQIIPINDEKIKIVDNFYTYLAIPISYEKSKDLKLNDILKIDFDGDFSTYDKASIEYIIDEGSKRLIFLKTDGHSELYTKYRKMNLNIIWWNYQGLKVSNNGIYEKEFIDEITGKSYGKVKAVRVQGPGQNKEVWIKVDKTAKDFSIISNYTDEELLEKGIPEEMVKNRNKINIYDEVILN